LSRSNDFCGAPDDIKPSSPDKRGVILRQLCIGQRDAATSDIERTCVYPSFDSTLGNSENQTHGEPESPTMTDFDAVGWVSRAQAFPMAIGRVPGVVVRSTTVAAPIAAAELQAIERALGSTVPTSLRALFTRGASAVDCSYVLEPEGKSLERLRAILPDVTRIFGGARLSPASELVDNCSALRDWARDTWIADDPDARSLWESAIPFLRLENGDYLALDLRTAASEPPVAYLSHDDESFLLAPTLMAFLAAWERLYYLGPEQWLLRPFTNDTGYLDPESERAARLRELLGH